MKYSYYRFLSKANIKGNKKSTAVVVLTCMLVIACTVISCFTFVTEKAVNEYKEDYMARALSLDPWFTPITDEAIAAISNVDHVESVDDYAGLQSICAFDILDIQSEDGKTDEVDERIKNGNAFTYICGLVGDEKKTVIAGENLDDSPVFSCLVPSMFYPFEDERGGAKDLDYIDGTSLVGKTITIKGFNGNIDLTYNYYNSEEDAGNDYVSLTSPEFKLKIVGTYYSSVTESGTFFDIYVSRETDLLMTKMALEDSGVDLSSDYSEVSRWWNDPSLHSYYVVVDDYDYWPYVFNQVYEMGYDIAGAPTQIIKESTVLMAGLFGTVGRLLTAAILIITIIILIQSSIASIKERKGQIGLLKAMGYKDRQIFLSMCLEQMTMTFKGFLIGGVCSAVFVAFTNFIFTHGSYQSLIYIIDWKMFIFYLCVSLAVAVFVPLICQLILHGKMKKIQPKDAMQ